jgi:hypothetical protein
MKNFDTNDFLYGDFLQLNCEMLLKNNFEIFVSFSVKPIFLGKIHNLYDIDEIEKA